MLNDHLDPLFSSYLVFQGRIKIKLVSLQYIYCKYVKGSQLGNSLPWQHPLCTVLSVGNAVSVVCMHVSVCECCLRRALSISGKIHMQALQKMAERQTERHYVAIE